MLEAIRELSPRVEYYSIDEFFFEAVPARGESFQELAERIKAQVETAAKVPVTIGIARSRTLAKLISDAAKPNGALDEAAEAALLAGRPVTEITGLAGRRQRRLAPWGIRTCLDLARADRRLVRSLLTATGEALWWELRGEPVLPLHPSRPRHKVISRGGSFGESTTSPIVLYAWLVRNLERLIEELRYHEVLAGKLAVWVGYRDGSFGCGAARLAAPSDRFDVLLETARPLLRRAWLPRHSAARMHLFAENLSPRRLAQQGLFEPPGDRAEAITRLKHEVNRRIGRFALRSAATAGRSFPSGAMAASRLSAGATAEARAAFCPAPAGPGCPPSARGAGGASTRSRWTSPRRWPWRAASGTTSAKACAGCWCPTSGVWPSPTSSARRPAITIRS